MPKEIFIELTKTVMWVFSTPFARSYWQVGIVDTSTLIGTVLANTAVVFYPSKYFDCTQNKKFTFTTSKILFCSKTEAVCDIVIQKLDELQTLSEDSSLPLLSVLVERK